MSASREKKLRQLQGPDKAKKNEPVEKKTPAWKTALYWVIGLLFVIAFIVVMLFNSNFFAKHSTAVTVGDHKITPAMMDIYYTSAYSNFYEQYGDYASYFFDNTKSLNEQIYDEETSQTWAGYFTESAKESLVWAYTLYDLAVKEGYTLSDDERSYIDAYLGSFKDSASSAGFSSANGYLAAYFGSGVTTKTYEEFMKVQLLAADYYNDKMASYEFSDAEMADYYAKNADTYDTVSLEYCYIRGAADPRTETNEDGEEVTVDPTEEESAAAMEAAREKAKELAEGGIEAMTAYDLRTLEDYDPTYLSYILPEAAGTWAYEADRTDKDIEIFETAQAAYVVHFVSRNNHDYNTKNIRLIQISPEEVPEVTNAEGNKDTEATAQLQEKAADAAKKQAKKVFEEWEDGEMTEESFTALVGTYSDDENSAVNGGLVENVADNQYTEEVNDWLYDSKRAAGDCEVFTEGNACYIVYFLGDGEHYQKVLVADAILNDAYNAWFEEASAPYTVTEHAFGMRLVETH